MMRMFTGFRLVMILFLAMLCVFSLGCQTTLNRAPTNKGGKAAYLSEGYSLLYDTVSKQKDVDKLLKIRDESIPLQGPVLAIAKESKSLYDWMEENKEQLKASSIELDAANLPNAEINARNKISDQTAKQLLLEDHFNRNLALAQIKATEYTASMAQTLAEDEADKARADRLMRFANRMSQINKRLCELIAVQGDKSE